MDKYHRQFPPKIGIFPTQSKSKKKLSYGRFFSHAKIFGYNTFCISLRVKIQTILIYLIIKLFRKIISYVLWINNIANYLQISEFSLHTVKAKKNSHMGVFFCFYCVTRKYHISRLLAMIFIHKTESIIFISNFIIKKIKIVYFHHM